MEEISAAYNAAGLSLAARAWPGESDAERLSNVQAVQVLNPATQAWDEVGLQPGVRRRYPGGVSLSPPGRRWHARAYRVYYLPGESDWTDFPARVEEPPLKVSQVEVDLGGRWDGSAFYGGHQLAAELRGVTFSLKNNLSPETTPGAGTGYANRAFRYGREQSLKFDRDFRDFSWPSTSRTTTP